MTRRVKLERARRFAEQVLGFIEPACERIAIAGSIRRQVAEVKDVEIVAVPRGIPRDLFGVPLPDAPNDLDRLIATLLEADRLIERLDTLGRKRMGQRYKALGAATGELGLDLFVVLPPAQWGTIFAIRTGPAMFSRELVTVARQRGRRVADGRVLEGDEVIPTPEERDFFRAVGASWVDPWDRFERG